MVVEGFQPAPALGWSLITKRPHGLRCTPTPLLVSEFTLRHPRAVGEWSSKNSTPSPGDVCSSLRSSLLSPAEPATLRALGGPWAATNSIWQDDENLKGQGSLPACVSNPLASTYSSHDDFPSAREQQTHFLGFPSYSAHPLQRWPLHSNPAH